MKRFAAFAALLAVQGAAPIARAADLPSRKSVPIYDVPPPFFYDGFYVGAQIGGAGYGDRAESRLGTNGAVLTHTNTSHSGGFIGGARAGYDWRYGPLVFGLVADISGTHIANNSTDYVFGYNSHNTLDVQGSLRGRIGYNYDRWLLYVTGGLNVAHIRHNYTTPLFQQSFDHVHLGPTVGVGVEYAITQHWRANLEYRASDVGTVRVNVPDPTQPLLAVRHRAGEGQITAGVSYSFGK